MPNDSWMKSVHHDGSPCYVTDEVLHIGSTLTLRLRVYVDAPIERIFLRTTPNGQQHMQDIRLMLDLVPNHSGSSNPWFLDTQADAATETADFHTFH